jgi:hypothetical protein
MRLLASLSVVFIAGEIIFCIPNFKVRLFTAEVFAAANAMLTTAVKIDLKCGDSNLNSLWMKFCDPFRCCTNIRLREFRAFVASDFVTSLQRMRTDQNHRFAIGDDPPDPLLNTVQEKAKLLLSSSGEVRMSEKEYSLMAR